MSLALDVTDVGRDIVRLQGTARRAHDQPPASEHPAYLAKLTERMAASFAAGNTGGCASCRTIPANIIEVARTVSAL